MAAMMDLDVLREIPGYKAILKSVLKSQIQFLMEQLSAQAGEESIILTASIQDGSLCHLGSNTGKGFLDGRDEIKAQFLGYCIKNQHKESPDTMSYQRSRTLLPPSRRPRPRIRPGPYSVPSPGSNNTLGSPPAFHVSSINSPTPYHMTSPQDMTSNHSNQLTNQRMTPVIKPESDNTVDTFLDTVTEDNNSQFTGLEQTDKPDEDNQASNEGVPEGGDLEGEGLEGFDMEGKGAGDSSQSSSEWGNSYSQDEPVVKVENVEGTDVDGASSHNLGGIAFPGLDNAHHDFSKNFPDLSAAELKTVLYPQGNSLSPTFPPFDPFSPQRKVPSLYWCHFCQKSLQNKTLYEYHIRAHSGVKPYQCEICHRKFAGKQVLETHMRLHSGERPFKCMKPGCDRAFTARSGLVYHMNKHHTNDS